jgi:hypothetical protein
VIRALLAAGAVSALAGTDVSRLQQMQAKEFSAHADSLARASSVSDSLAPRDSSKGAMSARDSSQFRKLPDRIMPLSRQMMFAGGFMIFLAVMITSLQNFNPND